ncbi:hypothetical protein BCU40_005915 [Vibrio lentus]|uniref:hypothetical protein n=1 Tax=Vibrio lentus TaxID=136468 RepID=UPI000C83A84E|nr:hypothetical protein [Vibrio lentus]PMI64590.1 hypothetical protein BCU40_16665 [Vibrio lentus]
MCKQSSYSKYQKRVIKFLNDQLGTDTPFTYERTQTNHLKVLIDGVPKPIFTGSTPSDCKSINNFMAEVKREIRASKVEEGDCKPTLQLPTPIKVSNDKLIQGCIKSLRTRLPVLKSQEETHVLETHEFDDINFNRLEAVKHSISFALQARKDGVYIKRNEMKELEQAILKHLNFMLPTMAYYSELLVNKNKYSQKSLEPLPAETVMNESDVQEFRATTVVNIDSPSIEVPNTESLVTSKVRTNSRTVKQTKDSASELMTMSTDNRVSLLRNLTKAQALTLIDDLNHALVLNREQDIEAVVELIRDKDLPLEAIISRLEAA